MVRISFLRVCLVACLSAALCCSGFAQIYTAPTPSAPAPAPAPTVSTPTATPTATPAPTSTPASTPTTTSAPASTAAPAATTSGSTTTASPAVVSASLPGYTTSQSGYGPGRTVAYVIAPFAVVAATYFIGHHQIEIDPNAGFVWPKHVNFADTTAHMRDEGIYGLKAAAYLTDYFQVEGNFAYMSHFESRLAPTTLDQTFGIQPRTVYGLLYDLNGVWNFAQRPVFGSRWSPYVTGGIGGLSTEVRHADAALIGGEIYRTDSSTRMAVLNPTSTVIVHDNTAFLSLNYGAGIKSMKMVGPMGFRVDF